MDPVDELLIEYYKKYPVGRDRLWAVVKQDHPEISRRRVAKFLENLEVHQVHRSNKTYTKSANVIVTEFPDERYIVDLIDLSKIAGSNNGINYWLTAIDHFSRYAFIRLLRDKTSEAVANQMKDILDSLTDLPHIIQSDNGGEFIGPEFQKVLKDFDIKHVRSNAHSPWTNGSIEVWNRTFKRLINRHMTIYNTNRYYDVVDEMVNNYNNTPHTVTKCKPIDVINKPELQEKVRQVMDKKVEDRKNMKTGDVFNVGDNVRISFEVLYQLLPQYKRADDFKKGYATNYSTEIFTIKRVRMDGTGVFISGYYVDDYKTMIKPNHLTKVDKDKLIKIDVVKETRRPPNRRIQLDELPVPNIQERTVETRRRLPINYNDLNNTGERRVNLPGLDDIFGDIDEEEIEN